MRFMVLCEVPSSSSIVGVDMGVSMLTDVQLRRLTPREKPYKLSDTGGLFILVQTSGS
ncbi:hypothetical protein AA0312_0399 [Acetobacter tropicalis NRIC 0312]|uniref:Uncharacterized protein n=1 Tax=Acetobacter tropicalis TaxID=104102 RepID=A0A511FMD9_9PROT|nr:hypothetical protein ATR1_067d0343 [Acetobacter tropicalis]GBR67374.1 hypothetical protein AA0312_0399 [Acetobacter tropicalis NRIC 0312]GEL49994.1 hypothetical protein ATR01nite_10690 [Acetobacter tropicalis]